MPYPVGLDTAPSVLAVDDRRYLRAASAFLASSWPGKGAGAAAAMDSAWRAAFLLATWAETAL
jgi:hypothetical protein